MSAKSKRQSGIIVSRRLARKRIRAATRAVLAGARSRVSHVGPNWKSDKHVRDIPDREVLDD